MDEHDARLLVRVAQFYYLEDRSQDEIAQRIQVSRSTVSRMLKQARARGMVDVVVHQPTRFSVELEQRLETTFGLREATVVNVGSLPHADVAAAVGSAAAELLLRVLKPGDRLGVSAGDAVARTVQAIPASAVKDVDVVQLGTATAGADPAAANNGRELASQMARKLGALDRLWLIPVPSLVDNAQIRDALLSDRGIREAMEVVGRCTVAVVGVGLPAPDGRTARVLGVSDGELAELRAHGAVGEICARWYDAAGAPCLAPLEERMIGPTLAQIRAIPFVLGVAYGPRKAAAIRAALRGGYLNGLVVDGLTALAVLEPAADGARPGAGGVPAD